MLLLGMCSLPSRAPRRTAFANPGFIATGCTGAVPAWAGTVSEAGAVVGIVGERTVVVAPNRSTSSSSSRKLTRARTSSASASSIGATTLPWTHACRMRARPMTRRTDSGGFTFGPNG
jgi:hypothetical protein